MSARRCVVDVVCCVLLPLARLAVCGLTLSPGGMDVVFPF